MIEWYNLNLLLPLVYFYGLNIQTAYCAAVSDVEPNNFLSSNPVVVLLSALILVVLCGVLLILCGGCTDMEVGTDAHPASHTGRGPGYDSVVTDANTRTLYASTTMPGDNTPYDTNVSAPLPYSLNPGGVQVAQGFTGYQGAPAGYQGVPQEPPPPSYNESIRGSNFTGWS